MKALVILLILIAFPGGAQAALPEVQFSDNVIETYEKKIAFRKIIRALLRSRQCEPREKEIEILGGLDSEFGCMFMYRDDWYALFYDLDAGYSLVYFDELAWDEFLSTNDSFFRYRSKRRGYPQFRGSQPQKWFRFTTMSARKLTVELEEMLRDFNARVEATENKYYILYDVYFQENEK